MNSKQPEALTSELDPDQLITFLEQFPSHNRYIVAISGGQDSMALAHLFFRIKDQINHPVEMVYVNHGIQDESNEWADFCRKQISEYGFSFKSLSITSGPGAGESTEAWAREVRYDMLSSLTDENTLVFTAHHLDDQAETMLLRLFRGVGTRGMGCMRVARPLHKGLLVRPLLNISRKQIEEYVSINHLSWIADNSNKDIAFDRNYLRQKIIPTIKDRWPAFSSVISRTIINQQEAGELLDVLAENDLSVMCDSNRLSINIDKLKTLNTARIKNVLMYWLREKHYAQPNHQHLEELINNVIHASSDKLPIVTWEGVELRKYKNRLYLLKTNKLNTSLKELQISFDKPIVIDNEKINWKIVEGKGVAVHYKDNHQFSLQFRQGGERIKLAKKGISKTIKQLFQENGVLPWKRESYPLVYIDNKIAAIPGICVDDNFAARDIEPGIVFDWTGYDKAIIHYE